MANEKKFLVCVDSDGCAIDSMTIKHEAAFGPAFIQVWTVKESLADEVLKKWNDLNLYQLSRGINRFQGLVAILEAYPDLSDSDSIKALKQWTQTTKALAPSALEAYHKLHPLSIFEKALTWSRRVNELIEELPLAQPFEGVQQVLSLVKEKADLAVVSSANPAAIEEEWKSSGLYDLVDVFYSQADGTKTECIKKLLESGYTKDRTIMVGDALGDYKAAENNGVFFYPILAAKEGASWQAFKAEYLEIFLADAFDATLQEQLFHQMKENLS